MAGKTLAIASAFGLGLLILSGTSGCDGLVLDGEVIIDIDDLPTECFTEDVVETGCFEEVTIVTVCDTVCVEDEFGFVDCFEECFEEPIVEVFCEDVLVGSFIVCE